MKIYKLDTASDFEKLNLCLAIGNFDGIHKGHQEIINKIKEIKSKLREFKKFIKENF